MRLQEISDRVRRMLNEPMPDLRKSFLEAHGREATPEEVRLMRKARRKLLGQDNPYQGPLCTECGRPMKRRADGWKCCGVFLRTGGPDIDALEQLLAAPVLTALHKQFEVPKEYEGILIRAMADGLMANPPETQEQAVRRSIEAGFDRLKRRGTQIAVQMMPSGGDGFEDE